MTSLTAYLIAEDVGVILEDGDDELDGLHRHVKLLVQRHRHNPVLELGGKQLQLVLNIHTKVSVSGKTDYVIVLI